MKKLLAILLLAGCVQGVSAQSTAAEKSLFEEVTGLKSKSDKFNRYMNMNGSFDAQDQDGGRLYLGDLLVSGMLTRKGRACAQS